MQLTPGVTINRGDSVSRQTIYDLLANAAGGTVQASDLDTSVQSVVAQSEAPSAPTPGKLWWDQTDQIMKVWTDVLEGTAVSCWLAIGPDRFDVAVLATEPVPFGAAVQLTGNGRRVKLPPDPDSLRIMGAGLAEWETAKVIGFNNHGSKLNASTAASGTWFSCAVDGLVWAWYPCNRQSGSDWISSAGAGGFDGLISGVSGLTATSGISEVRGGLIWQNVSDVQALTGPWLLYSTHRMTSGEQYWGRRPFSGPRLTKHTAG